MADTPDKIMEAQERIKTINQGQNPDPQHQALQNLSN